jgi:quercetin dioxygenase-like cupin family protein
MRRLLAISICLAIGIVVGAVGNQALHAQSPAVRNTPVLRTELTAIQGTEGYLNVVEQDPGGVGRKQYHTGDVFFYVTSGSMKLEMDGKPAVTVNQGQAFHLAPKTVITPGNASTTAPVTFLVFGLVGKGQPPSVQVP